MLPLITLLSRFCSEISRNKFQESWRTTTARFGLLFNSDKTFEGISRPPTSIDHAGRFWHLFTTYEPFGDDVLLRTTTIIFLAEDEWGWDKSWAVGLYLYEHHLLWQPLFSLRKKKNFDYQCHCAYPATILLLISYPI